MTGDLVLAGPMDELEIVWKLAQRLSDTDFVPDALRRSPNAVLAAILTGRELGIGPMQSLQSINVIQGKPTLAPELMRALVYRAGHRMDVTDSTQESCTVSGTRSDSGATASVTWTLEDAKRANLTKGAWITYPRAMLLARATSELCRLLFADVIAGVSYTPEEIGGEIPADPEPEVVEEAEIVDEATGEILEPSIMSKSEVTRALLASGLSVDGTLATLRARLQEALAAEAAEEFVGTGTSGGEAEEAPVVPGDSETVPVPDDLAEFSEAPF